MLSYQHAYHAGNPADVMKHEVLAQLIMRLIQKPAPVTYIETHAGRGLYPVNGPEMQKKAEYLSGAAKLYNLVGPSSSPPSPPSPQITANHRNVTAELPYISVLLRCNSGEFLHVIPGSPAIANDLLRPSDSLFLFEKHPGEFSHLAENTKHWKRTTINKKDGPENALSLIKPGTRTLIHIDPSYENPAEYIETAKLVEKIAKKWPKAVIMVWVPLLKNNPHQPLLNYIQALDIPSTFWAEIRWNPTAPDGRGLHGTGQLVLNLPYQLHENIEKSLTSLCSFLKLTPPQTTFLIPPR